MKFPKCKKLCCLNWVASLVLTNPSDEKNVFEFQQRLNCILKSNCSNLNDLQKVIHEDCVEKQSSRFQNFHSSFMFYFQLSSLALKTAIDSFTRMQIKVCFGSDTTASSGNNKKTNPMIKFIRKAFQYQMQHDPAAVQRRNLLSLSFDTFLRARAPSDQFRSCENKSYATSCGWLTCACACALHRTST